jgi:hypothetical protein
MMNHYMCVAFPIFLKNLSRACGESYFEWVSSSVMWEGRHFPEDDTVHYKCIFCAKIGFLMLFILFICLFFLTADLLMSLCPEWA